MGCRLWGLSLFFAFSLPSFLPFFYQGRERADGWLMAGYSDWDQGEAVLLIKQKHRIKFG